MQLSVIIVSYNTAKLTVQTVKSVYRSVSKKSKLAENFEVIVVDNDSHDDTLKLLEKLQLPRLKLYNSHENLGFGRGNNYGFKKATGQYILFLNSDTIVKRGVLEKMIAYYQKHAHDKKPLGLLAAQLLNKDGTFQPQGGDLPSLWTVAATMFFLDDLPFLCRFIPSVQHTGRRFDKVEIEQKDFIAKGWVAGTAVMCQRDTWEDEGGWDENIFMYGEDQEVCYRMHQAGFCHGILTGARITHLGSASSSSANALLGELRGYLYFWRKHKTKNQWDGLKLILWLAMLVRVFVFGVIKKDKKRADIYSQGLTLVEEAVWSKER
ncbi:glycosyltransferase family 2 protein [bacterium]|nr:glycosyltransferase family 2 protein [bacterium]